ncbi:UDP-N-acetylglucosamine 2-epimerase [Helicobacter sp. 12S02634-8]|uniref:non-hydrolyzing UDP-N-acetylglucosamine 2-epimerase n=1 Tax=Helicobacter sp. 12S02634-8 TaxID=1476199 RepID=UPI000BA5EE40|nr:UDP-N-acetylglucosamine 2-epimerase (non-hydrolyzing) [Helicobacter sp. 12S02634-8]PAF48103.1 UDP-N-acetylglucosamine 2-epimerase [Helicobacter sp. 12S02634-8]
MKILTILGARPQFIKAACLQRVFQNYPNIQEIIAHTNQHYDHAMDAVFFQELKLKAPTIKLTQPIKHHSTSQNSRKARFAMLAHIYQGLQPIIVASKPDAILIYGDTNSTLAGALAGFHATIPLIHIEAGVRSKNLQMPEECNRIATDKLSTLLFCPSVRACENLKNESLLPQSQIYDCGDIMQDNALYYAPYAKAPQLPLQANFILASIHRANNTDDPQRLQAIFEALNTIAKHTQVLCPLHPRTEQALKHQGLKFPHICFTPPLSYLETLYLLQRTQAVFTDSGGLQKEAYFFAKPCFVLRDESEWEELLEHRCAYLVGAQKEKIIESFGNMPYLFAKSPPPHLYGNGQAGDKIVKKILEVL